MQCFTVPHLVFLRGALVALGLALFRVLPVEIVGDAIRASYLVEKGKICERFGPSARQVSKIDGRLPLDKEQVSLRVAVRRDVLNRDEVLLY